ncbi:zinc finger protein 62-like [Oppia nitens]|uniref:zinc finger protein 62-like n=1 Tax=Oppia nitens TaxID=1686743 RepID=UPI0023DCAB46|nr:zinc finger protein 62-like [Oppia nitens]
MVNALRREVQCLANNLMRYQLFAEKYRKLLNELQTIDEISVEFDEDLRQMRQQLMTLSDDNDCEVVIDEDINHDMNSRYLDKECQTTTITANPMNDNLIVTNDCIKNVKKDIDDDNYEKVVVDCDVNYKTSDDDNADDDYEDNDDNDNSDEEYTNTLRNGIHKKSTRSDTTKKKYIRCDIQTKAVMTKTSKESLEQPIVVKRQSNGKYRCDWTGCEKEYKCRYVLHKHILQHRGVTYQCSYKDCNKSFVDYTSYRKHLKHHSDTYQCKHDCCTYTTGVKKFYESHLKSHLTETPFQCTIDGCGQQFKTDDHMKAHVLRRHPNEMPDVKWMPCPEPGCEFRTKSSNSMTVHTLTHTKPHECGRCGKRYATANGVRGCESRHEIESSNGESALKYQCDWPGCSREYRNAFVFKRHLMSHKGVKYQCSYTGCNKSFVDYYTFRKHIQNHKNTYKCRHDGCSYSSGVKRYLLSHEKSHIKDTPFQCNIDDCEQVFKTEDNMRAHQLRKHPDSLADVQWMNCSYPGCEYKTKSPNAMNCHEIWHKKPYECQKCSQRYASAKQMKGCLEKHNISDDIDGNGGVGGSEVGKHRCDWPGCDKVYRDTFYLKRHRLMHTGYQYQCRHRECGKSFSDYTSYRNHVNHHKGTHRCPHDGCQYTTGSKKYLRSHMNKHVKDTPFRCGINDCEQVFKTELQMSNHQLRIHPDEFPDTPWIGCDFPACDYRAKTSIAIREHRAWHIKPYQCTDCDKRCQSSKELHRHRITHHNAVRIACEWYACERQFTTRAEMLDHMNVHTGQESYRCDWPGCDKSFITKHSVKAHLYRVHTKKAKLVANF